MKNDPYAKFIDMCRHEGSVYNPPMLRLGTIVSESPLVVKTGELQLTKEDLLVNYDLIDSEREFKLENTSASGNACEGGISSIAIPKGILKLKGILKKDDTVVLQPISDSQSWIILCRVVRL